MYWWESLSDGELRARLVNRGIDVDGVDGMVQHLRSGCRICIKQVAAMLR